MANVLEVKQDGKKIYDIRLTDGFGALTEALEELGCQRSRKVCIVSDSNVAGLYGQTVCDELKKYFEQVVLYTFPAGEASKNMTTVEGVYAFLIEQHFDRHDMLAALGGGVVGDLTGFVAATYLRGIDFFQIPTTLLSQVDSSIGGKTGVDFLQYKNMVGAFYMPKLVYMNLQVLHTLPKEQLVSGFGEILKHGLIKNVNYFTWMQEHEAAIHALEYEAVEEMIYQSCRIKREVVERDPKEQGERALLNFGHTIGHAVEKLSNFALYHGECVGLGIVAAAFISMRQGKISAKELQNIEETLTQFGLKTRVAGFDAEAVLTATKSDKKMVGRQVKFILLEQPGRAYIEKELTDAEIMEGISYILTDEDHLGRN